MQVSGSPRKKPPRGNSGEALCRFVILNKLDNDVSVVLVQCIVTTAKWWL